MQAEVFERLLDTLQQQDWVQGFINPQKRLFWGFLLSALIIAMLWLMLIQRKSLAASVALIFNKDVWFGRSARADYLSMVVNTLILRGLAASLLTKTIVATWLFSQLHDVFQGRPQIVTLSDWQVATLFTVFLFLLDDFARYWLHRLLHTLPFLWAFHKVHHSANHLTPLTIYRTHPVESVLFICRSALVQGFSIGLFIFFFGEQVTLLQILGANVFSFGFNLLGANLRHSPVPLAYWRPLEAVFISPAQHHIHHSRDKAHHNKNYGVALAIWDKLFGSFYPAQSMQILEYGVYEKQNTDPHSLHSLYIRPFIEGVTSLKSALHRVFTRKQNKTPLESSFD